MQDYRKDGTFGKVQELTNEGLRSLLENKETEHVEVFKGTPENIDKRKKRIGKKFKLTRKYTKVPKIK